MITRKSQGFVLRQNKFNGSGDAPRPHYPPKIDNQERTIEEKRDVMATVELTVTDMACNVCVENITKAVQAIDTNAAIDADTQTKQVTITTTATDTVVRDAIAAAGYTIAA